MLSKLLTLKKNKKNVRSLEAENSPKLKKTCRLAVSHKRKKKCSQQLEWIAGRNQSGTIHKCI